MKIFIIHDKKGNIKGTLVSKFVNVGITPSPGRYVHTIEKSGLKTADLQRYLYDLHTKFKISLTSGKPKILPKSRPSSPKKPITTPRRKK